MRKLVLVVLFLLILSLTGCMHEYQLSDETTGVVAEYMAGILLEHDENYEKKLLDQKELDAAKAEDLEEEEKEEAKKDPAEDVKESEENEGAAEPEKEYTITEVIGAEGFNITYNSYKLCNVYPEDETNAYFSLTPLEGNQLLVASFMVENTGKKEKKLDLRKSKVDYQLDINVGTIYKPLLTLLENNLKYIDMNIGTDKKEEVLLIFEVSKDTQLEDINLIISNGSKTEIIDIK